MIAITVKLAASDIVPAASVLEGPMKQLLAAVLIGVAIAGVGLAAEAVFAKPINQAGTVTSPEARSQRVHVLDPIIINNGD